MLCCDHCGTAAAQEPHGIDWWQTGRQMMDARGALCTGLGGRRDFCSEPCLRAYYAAALPADHPTQRLDRAPTGAAADRARRGGA